MNDKITFPRLATLLADRSGRSKRFSEDFLREFFSLISETLEAGESVKVKGLGTFRLSHVEPRRSVDVTTGQPMEISGHSKVVFVPSKEIAEAVNSPFEAFSAIEIRDNADISQLFSREEIDLQEREEIDDESVPDQIDLETPLTSLDNLEDLKIIDDTSLEPHRETEMEENVTIRSDSSDGNPAISDSEKDMREDETPMTIEPHHSTIKATTPPPEKKAAHFHTSDTHFTKPQSLHPDEDNAIGENTDSADKETLGLPSPRKTWVRTLMISLGAAVVALIATFCVWYIFTTNDFNRFFRKTATTETATPTDGFMIGEQKTKDENPVREPVLTVDSTPEQIPATEDSEVPTTPSDILVYDTISTTRYLTTMAKKHYGNYNLWPFIYEENKSILGHPDRIRPGTPVIVPKLSKYGINPDNPDDVDKAKKLGAEIYARYGKNI